MSAESTIKTLYSDPWGGGWGPVARQYMQNSLYGKDWNSGAMKNAIDAGAQGADAFRAAQSATQSAAGSPTVGQAGSYLEKVLSGQTLHQSPEMAAAEAARKTALGVDLASARRQSEADLAGQQASQQAAFGRSGMSYSTGAQQADQASQAALQARLNDQEAQARANLASTEAVNRQGAYQQERALQSQAAGMAPGVAAFAPQMMGQAAQHAGQVANQYLQPFEQGAGIGNALYKSDATQVSRPGFLNYLGEAVGTIGNLAGAAGGK